MRRVLTSLLILLPLAGCTDEQPPLSPSAPGDLDGPGFALSRPSELLVPAGAPPARLGTGAAASTSTTAVPPGPSHIVWQNARTGLRVMWHMTGPAWNGEQNPVETIDTAWTIAASADFTGDGQADLLWQRRSTGDQVIWHMNGFGWTGQQTPLRQTTLGWWIAGAGDFTGDGKPDILWQHRGEGRQVIWHMNGTAWEGSQNELQQTTTQWRIAGVGDFTGDGRPDIVWQYQAAGRQVIWHMNGTTWGGSQNELATNAPEWYLAGVGDFTANRGPDILWQNRSTGRQIIWHMNGTSWSGAQNELTQVTTEWHIATTMPAAGATAARAPSEALHKSSYTAFRKPPYGMKAATPWLAAVHTGAAGVPSSVEIDYIELWAEINGVAQRMDHNSYSDGNYGGQLRYREPWFGGSIESMPMTMAGGVMTIRPSDRTDKVWHPFLGTYPNPRKDLSAATRVWFVSRVRLNGPVAIQGGIDFYEKVAGYPPETNRLEEGAATDWVYAQGEWITLTNERSTEVVNPIQLSAPAADGTYPAGRPITATFALQNADDNNIRLAAFGIDTRRVTPTDPYCDPWKNQWVEAFSWAVDVDFAPGRVYSHTGQWAAPAAGDYCIRVVEQRHGVYHRNGTEAGQPLYQQPYASFPVKVIRVR